MATVITMPRLSPTMEEGVLLKWTKKPGDKINPGDVIAEVETDKANMDFPLEDEGTLLKLLVEEGATVKLGAPVAILGEPGEDVAHALAEAGAAAAPTGKPPEEAQEKATAKEQAPVEDQLIPLSPMRRTIARRLTESKATVPHFYVTMDARADALWAFQQEVKDASDVKITLNDLVLRAVAVALRRLPEANASWT